MSPRLPASSSVTAPLTSRLDSYSLLLLYSSSSSSTLLGLCLLSVLHFSIPFPFLFFFFFFPFPSSGESSAISRKKTLAVNPQLYRPGTSCPRSHSISFRPRFFRVFFFFFIFFDEFGLGLSFSSSSSSSSPSSASWPELKCQRMHFQTRKNSS